MSLTYQFNRELARLYGVDEAIFLHNIFYWTMQNEANGINLKEHDGVVYAWTHNSMKAFSRLFPFWTQRQLERIVKSCIEQGLLIAVNLNMDKTNRTLWYTVTEKVVSIYANGEMHFPKWGKPIHETVECIDNIYNINLSPDNKPDNKQEGIRPRAKEDRPKAYGENGWVKLTDEELKRLIEKYGAELTAKAIEYVDLQAEKTKNRNGWKSWGAVIRNAVKGNWGGIADE